PSLPGSGDPREPRQGPRQLLGVRRFARQAPTPSQTGQQQHTAAQQRPRARLRGRIERAAVINGGVECRAVGEKAAVQIQRGGVWTQRRGRVELNLERIVLQQVENRVAGQGSLGIRWVKTDGIAGPEIVAAGDIHIPVCELLASAARATEEGYGQEAARGRAILEA